MKLSVNTSIQYTVYSISDNVLHKQMISETIWQYMTLPDKTKSDLTLSFILGHQIPLPYLILSGTISHFLTQSDAIWSYLRAYDTIGHNIWHHLAISGNILHYMTISDFYGCDFITGDTWLTNNSANSRGWICAVACPQLRKGSESAACALLIC